MTVPLRSIDYHRALEEGRRDLALIIVVHQRIRWSRFWVSGGQHPSTILFHVPLDPDRNPSGPSPSQIEPYLLTQSPCESDLSASWRREEASSSSASSSASEAECLLLLWESREARKLLHFRTWRSRLRREKCGIGNAMMRPVLSLPAGVLRGGGFLKEGEDIVVMQGGLVGGIVTFLEGQLPRLVLNTALKVI